MQLYLAARVGCVPWPRRRSMAGIGRYTNLACSLPCTQVHTYTHKRIRTQISTPSYLDELRLSRCTAPHRAVHRERAGRGDAHRKRSVQNQRACIAASSERRERGKSGDERRGEKKGRKQLAEREVRLDKAEGRDNVRECGNRGAPLVEKVGGGPSSVPAASSRTPPADDARVSSVFLSRGFWRSAKHGRAILTRPAIQLACEVGREERARAKCDHGHGRSAELDNAFTRYLLACPSECKDISGVPRRRGGQATTYDIALHRDDPEGVANLDTSLHCVYSVLTKVDSSTSSPFKRDTLLRRVFPDLQHLLGPCA